MITINIKDSVYYSDENGNMWSAQRFTEAEAMRCSQSLEKCYNCIDCDSCYNCIDCISCSNCKMCISCECCSDCERCDECVGCSDSVYCTESKHCHHCANIVRNEPVSERTNKSMLDNTTVTMADVANAFLDLSRNDVGKKKSKRQQRQH